MPQTRESALQNRAGSFLEVLGDRRAVATTAPDQRNHAVHLVSRVAVGLSDEALAELVSVADQLRSQEGLLPVELTAQW
ncbi:hypothetical protein ACWDYH_08540 [Nocardia goodfellowii]